MSKGRFMFDYTRVWYEFAFSSNKVRPVHHAIYLYAVQLNNMLGWKESFGFPASQAMEVAGIASYNTYIKAFRELVDWKFITLIEKSENQFKANIIALSKIDKSLDKSLDNSVLNHMTEQERITIQGTSQINYSVDIPNTNMPKNLEKERENSIPAFTFLKNNFPERLNTITGKYSKHFKNLDEKQKLVDKFNNSVVMGRIDFTEDMLFAKLDNFMISWVDNLKKYGNNHKEGGLSDESTYSNIPIG